MQKIPISLGLLGISTHFHAPAEPILWRCPQRSLRSEHAGHQSLAPVAIGMVSCSWLNDARGRMPAKHVVEKC